MVDSVGRGVGRGAIVSAFRAAKEKRNVDLMKESMYIYVESTHNSSLTPSSIMAKNNKTLHTEKAEKIVKGYFRTLNQSPSQSKEGSISNSLCFWLVKRSNLMSVGFILLLIIMFVVSMTVFIKF